MNARFELLADHPEAVPRIAQWWFDEWGPTTSSPTLQRLTNGLGHDLRRDGPPIHLVAIVDDEVVGVAVLKDHEMRDSFPQLKHWLGNVYIHPDYRGRGLASALVKRAAGLAHHMGITRLHLATQRLDGGLYARCGCEPLARTTKRGLDVLVMTYDIDEPVHLAPHDPTWADRFEQEKALLEPLLAPWLVGGIEHVGSTAVPGLIAKPLIDIMAGVESLEASRPAIEALSDLGYGYYPYRPHLVHWFCKPSPWKRTHHLHLIPFESPRWSQTLAFRNRLREDPRVRSEYAALKRQLAQEHEFDREAYTDGKEAFVRRVVEDTLGADRPWAS